MNEEQSKNMDSPMFEISTYSARKSSVQSVKHIDKDVNEKSDSEDNSKK